METVKPKNAFEFCSLANYLQPIALTYSDESTTTPFFLGRLNRHHVLRIFVAHGKGGAPIIDAVIRLEFIDRVGHGRRWREALARVLVAKRR